MKCLRLHGMKFYGALILGGMLIGLLSYFWWPQSVGGKAPQAPWPWYRPVLRIAHDELLLQLRIPRRVERLYFYLGLVPPDDPYADPLYLWEMRAKHLQGLQYVLRVPLKHQLRRYRRFGFDGRIFYKYIYWDKRKLKVSRHYVTRITGSAGAYRLAPVITEGPRVGCITTTSAVVAFGFNQPTAGVLQVGEQAHPFARACKHEITLTALQPGHAYRYSIHYGPRQARWRSATAHFQTAPRHAAVFKFAVFGDNRGNPLEYDARGYINAVNYRTVRALARDIRRRQVALAIANGDMIHGKSEQLDDMWRQYETWWQAVEPLAAFVPIYTVLGNHEAAFVRPVEVHGHIKVVAVAGQHSPENLFAQQALNFSNGPEYVYQGHHFRENTYAFGYAAAYFIILNNESIYHSQRRSIAGFRSGRLHPRVLSWLRQRLQAAVAQGYAHIFVFCHQPAFPNGKHLKDSMYDNGDPESVRQRDLFWRLLCRYPVRALVCSHEHNYSRTVIDNRFNATFSRPLTQFIVGSGGAPVYPRDRKTPWDHYTQAFSLRKSYTIFQVAASKVTFQTWSLDDQIIDQGELTP